MAMDSAMTMDWPSSDWRKWPVWREWYPRWAEPIFSDGLNVKSQVDNNRDKFSVNIDAYQFKPEEIQVNSVYRILRNNSPWATIISISLDRGLLFLRGLLLFQPPHEQILA
jgi:hypothetical protein